MFRVDVTGDVLKEFEKQFLYLIKCYLKSENVPAGYIFDTEKVFGLAAIHNVMPIVYKAAKNSGSDLQPYKRSVISSVGIQSRKNILLCSLYGEMVKNGFDPIIVKGPVCAAFYPDFDLRLSSDFDIVVRPEIKEDVHSFLLDKGYCCSGESYNIADGLHIEVHTTLAEGDGYIHKQAEKLFSDVFQNTVYTDIYKTLSYTDNLLYLIYHALKHFTVSGFGIRQVMDIALFADAKKTEINFNLLFKSLKMIKGDIFAANIFNVAEKYLGFDFSGILNSFSEETLFLDEFAGDLLDAGVFGKSGEDRLHSGGVVKNAVENTGKSKILPVLFPSFSYMKSKHKILKYIPVLLPFFWIMRIGGYIFRAVFGRNKVSPEKTLKIAGARIELLRKMEII